MWYLHTSPGNERKELIRLCVSVEALVCHSWKPIETSGEGQCFLYLSGDFIICAHPPSNCNHGRLGHREWFCPWRIWWWQPGRCQHCTSCCGRKKILFKRLMLLHGASESLHGSMGCSRYIFGEIMQMPLLPNHTIPTLIQWMSEGP